MIKPETVKDLALSFPDAIAAPHFHRTSFRVKKKIFATVDEKEMLLCVKFSETEQSSFSAYDKSIIYPVPGAWGKKGYTYIDLKKVRKSVLKDALKTSYDNVSGARKLNRK